METGIFGFLWVTLYPTVTTNSSVAAQVDDVRRAPLTAVRPFNPVMKCVALSAAPLAQTL